MSLAPWRSRLTRALHRNRSLRESRYFQLATVTPEGTPANRTVVFRGFRDNTNQLQIVTDARSEKISDLQQHPQAEICWYFTKSREQFRLRGNVCLITAQSASFSSLRQTLWQQLSDNARLQFVWPHPKAERTQGEDAFTNSFPSQEIPPDTFVVLLFFPQQVDYLLLKGNPQNRYLYWLDEAENWSVKEVNP
ncbi:MAG: pyridoxamine 5'-phosphate oxidase [Cyanobacteria bacterium SW_9_44_58]|nr:MAG: pyridoxamine 5'-phosphate oxidase [Cyanobacteria bacterium SW_9_44_58]